MPGRIRGRGVQWEARLIRERFYADQKTGLQLVLPVVLPGCSPEDIPLWLASASATHYVVSEYTVSGAEQLIRLLTGCPLEDGAAAGPGAGSAAARRGLSSWHGPAGTACGGADRGQPGR
jgi:hypothetical protein